MNRKSIYSNPPINKPLFLFVQLDLVGVESKSTIIRYRVAPLSCDLGGTYIYSRLAQTERTEDLWNACRQTFRFQGYDIPTGRWGKIYLVPSKWQKMSFSTIQYIPQTDIDRSKATDCEKMERLGAIPWDATTQEEAQEFVRRAMLTGGDQPLRAAI